MQTFGGEVSLLGAWAPVLGAWAPVSSLRNQNGGKTAQEQPANC
jgi:hypothetical protein